MYKKALIGLFTATFILTGCGGGSSDSSGPSYSGPTGAVTISDQTSAKQAASFASGVALNYGMASMSGTYTPFAATSERATLETAGTIARKYTTMAFNLASSKSASASQPQACATSGNVTITDNYAGATPQAGDTVSFKFNDCVQVDTKLTGRLTLTVNSYVSSMEFSAKYTFNQLRTTTVSSGDTYMVHGDYTASVTETVTTFTASVTGNSLYSEATIGGNFYQEELSNFSYVDIDTYGDNVSFDHNFTYASSQLGGSITVTTVTPFQIFYGPPTYDIYPSVGEIVVTGAGGAKVRLTAVDATNARVEWDADGDGLYEGDTGSIPWSSL